MPSSISYSLQKSLSAIPSLTAIVMFRGSKLAPKVVLRTLPGGEPPAYWTWLDFEVYLVYFLGFKACYWIPLICP